MQDGVRYALCFDIGGTHLRCAVYDDTGRRRAGPRIRATPNYLARPAAQSSEMLSGVVHECAGLGRELLAGGEPHVVVVGYPGPVANGSVALRSPTILGPERDEAFDVGAAFRTVWPTAEVSVLNDLTCAGLFYVERGYRDFCVITVGSGIGNKVFVGAEPVVGPGGRGGEIGHLKACACPDLPFAYDWPEIGRVSSGRGAARLARAWAEARPRDFERSMLEVEGMRKAPNDISDALARAFGSGDELACRIVAAAAYPLAYAIAGMHQSIGTETFLIVGGFAKALGEGYRNLLVSSVSGMTWNLGQNWNDMIRVGETNEEEGVAGAAREALRLFAKQRAGR